MMGTAKSHSTQEDITNGTTTAEAKRGDDSADKVAAYGTHSHRMCVAKVADWFAGGLSSIMLLPNKCTCWSPMPFWEERK